LAEVVQRLVEARIPVAPVNDLDAVVRDEQVVARGSVCRTEAGWIPAPAPRIDAG